MTVSLLFCTSKISVAQPIPRDGTAKALDSDRNRGRAPTEQAIGRARVLIEQKKDYQAAISELDAVIKLEPRLSFPFAWRALAYMRQGQLPQAIADADEALKLNAKNSLALSVRGNAYFRSNDNGKALVDLNAAIALGPPSKFVYNNRGLVHLDMGEAQKAINDFNNAVRIDPLFADGYGSLGRAYLQLKQNEKAIAAYDQGIRLDPSFARRFFGRGMAYHKSGELDQALADYDEAIRLDPKLTDAYWNRGMIRVSKGAMNDAIADFSQTLAAQPNNVSALLGRARAYEFSGDIEKAKIDFDSALVVMPQHSVAIAGRDRIGAKIAMAKGGPRPVFNRSNGRIALVIGNSQYKAVDPLPNPRRDAKLVADALGRTGFQKVQLLVDSTRADIAAALKAFEADAAGADWAVIYFAGHGLELDGANYLVPVDVNFENDDDIPKESIALDQVLNAVGKAQKLRLVVLDACRENPFATENKSKTGSASGRGLARIEPESGTLVAFATKHGRLATDGAGDNSPFATAFVSRIPTPGLEINQLFRLVHDDVFASTNQKQEPFTYGQLSAQEFYFRSR